MAFRAQNDKEITRIGNYCFRAVYMTDDFDTPESVPEALACPEKEKWEDQRTNGFYQQKVLERGTKESVLTDEKKGQMKRKIMKRRTIFRKKRKANKEIFFSKRSMC
jgi:hypothetical protein